MPGRREFVRNAACAGLILAVWPHSPAAAQLPPVAGGSDVVAMLRGQGIAAGLERLHVEYRQRVFLFATPENRAAFIAGPERYLPQYGGLCAEAMAGHFLAHPLAGQFTVKDGKLYLFRSAGARGNWLAHEDAMIAEADAWFPMSNLE